MIWEARTGQFDLKEGLPLQLCGIQMFAIPLALFSRGRIGDYMREFVFAYGTVGFLLALLLPIPALQIYPVFHFRSMQSMLYHAALGFVALMLPHLNYRPDIRNVRKAYAVLVACALFTGAVNMLFGSNYLYTSALPIPFDLLPWPLYLPFLLAFALLVGRLPYTRIILSAPSDAPEPARRKGGNPSPNVECADRIGPSRMVSRPFFLHRDAEALSSRQSLSRTLIFLHPRRKVGDGMKRFIDSARTHPAFFSGKAFAGGKSGENDVAEDEGSRFRWLFKRDDHA